MERLDVLAENYKPTEHWTDKEWDTFTTWLKGMLQVNDEVKVTFNKKDGSERVMRCTLNPKLLPKVEVKEGTEKPERKKSEAVIAVYDLDAQGWRSFTIKSVTRVNFTIQ
jgi:hypothetical protein